jgi:hypothetical protein
MNWRMEKLFIFRNKDNEQEILGKVFERETADAKNKNLIS